MPRVCARIKVLEPSPGNKSPEIVDDAVLG